MHSFDFIYFMHIIAPLKFTPRNIDLFEKKNKARRKINK